MPKQTRKREPLKIALAVTLGKAGSAGDSSSSPKSNAETQTWMVINLRKYSLELPTKLKKMKSRLTAWPIYKNQSVLRVMLVTLLEKKSAAAVSEIIPIDVPSTNKRGLGASV